MALTNQSLEELNSFITEFDQRDYVQLGYDYFMEAQSDPNYEIWVNGTDFGKQFNEKFETIRQTAASLDSLYQSLTDRLKAFYDIQENINKTGNQ